MAQRRVVRNFNRDSLLKSFRMPLANQMDSVKLWKCSFMGSLHCYWCWENEKEILPKLRASGGPEQWGLQTRNCFGERGAFFFFNLKVLSPSEHMGSRSIHSAGTLNKPHCLQVCFVKERIDSSPLHLRSVNSRIKAGESGRGLLAAGEVCLCLFARH